MTQGIDPGAKPSGDGCKECLETSGWWFHLRRCAQCGHIGCCDSSPNRHATAHFHETGHPIMQSFEPGEDWFWNYVVQEEVEGPQLTKPHSHPLTQPTPGPAGSVLDNWMELVD